MPNSYWIRRVAVAAGTLAILWLGCTPEDSLINKSRKYRVDITVEGNGDITRSTSQNPVTDGDTIILYGIPGKGAFFLSWDGDTQSVANPLILEVRKDLSVKAVFKTRPSGSMVLISARDSSFQMGSIGELAVGDLEQPAHRVHFTYDFFLQSHEVTVEQYRELMGKPNVDGNDSLPVRNVSWYDAVLYCNARSKAEGYDTVYSYTAVCKENQSCPYVLENLTIHYDRFGYRLPTEAEWEYACRAGTNTQFFWGNRQDSAGAYAWYFENADESARRVMQKHPNGFGLYDMAGNVAEWVNDWMARYPDSSVLNPIGPYEQSYAEYEESGERPVRGGAYGLPVAYLRSSGRRYGPYETAPKIKLRGIGFRPALGTFYTSSDWNASSSTEDRKSTVVIDGKHSDLLGFLGSTKMRLAFVQDFGALDKKLFVLDYTGAKPELRVLRDSVPMATPSISPDGQTVAYGSYAEGYDGYSEISLQSVMDTSARGLGKIPDGFIPRWWTGIGQTDTFLIYTDGASMNVNQKWLSEKTYRRQVSGTKPVGGPEVLWDIGSYHGGLSRDGRFLATGYTKTKLIDLQINDTALFYFETPYNGRHDNAQTCNVSISPSTVRTDEVLLLDFGYSRQSELVGSSYGVHEYIFKCNSKLLSWEHVEDWYYRPAGFNSWNHVEYTNHPDYAVAVAQSKYSDSSDAIFIIDLNEENRYLRIASGKNLRYPGAWIDPFEVPESPDPYHDFGRYDVPVQWTSQILLAQKLRLLWKRRNETEVAFFGSSPMSYGVEPAALESFVGVNFASQADFLGTPVALSRDYALVHLPKLKAVCLDLAPGVLDRDPDAEPLRLNGLYASKGYELDKSYNFWRDSIPQSVMGRIAQFDSSSWHSVDSNGFFRHRRQQGAWGTALLEGDDYTLNDVHVQRNLRDLEILCDSAAAKGVQVLVVNFPQAPGYKNTSLAGRFGPRNETMDLLISHLRELEEKKSNFHFYDANENGNHDYTSDHALDANHLQYAGALRLTTRLDSVLVEICH